VCVSTTASKRVGFPLIQGRETVITIAAIGGTVTLPLKPFVIELDRARVETPSLAAKCGDIIIDAP
jgi:hypothetical protein